MDLIFGIRLWGGVVGRTVGTFAVSFFTPVGTNTSLNGFSLNIGNSGEILACKGTKGTHSGFSAFRFACACSLEVCFASASLNVWFVRAMFSEKDSSLEGLLTIASMTAKMMSPV